MTTKTVMVAVSLRRAGAVFTIVITMANVLRMPSSKITTEMFTTLITQAAWQSVKRLSMVNNTSSSLMVCNCVMVIVKTAEVKYSTTTKTVSWMQMVNKIQDQITTITIHQAATNSYKLVITFGHTMMVMVNVWQVTKTSMVKNSSLITMVSKLKGVLLMRMVLSVTMMLTQVKWLATVLLKLNQVFGLTSIMMEQP